MEILSAQGLCAAGLRGAAMKEKILIISANEEMLEAISADASEISAELGFDGISAAADSSVKDRFSENDINKYGMAVISAPLKDEYGLSLAAHICSNTDAAVIFIASQKNAEAAFRRLKGTGAIVIPRPINKLLLHQIMRFMNEERKRRKQDIQQVSELDRKLAETKVIDRAKFALMQYLSITEDEAHSQLRKQAMDLRKTIYQTAEDILKTYEYL